MPRQVQLRRGTTVEHSTFTGALGEITVDTDKKTLIVHDGATAGGVPLARQSALDALIRSGTGSPEGVVTASVGTLYLRTNGGANTTLYVKESGSGSTGWVAK
jgi:hypothetical protein